MKWAYFSPVGQFSWRQPKKKEKGDVPSEWAFSRFMKKLAAPEALEMAHEMFDEMVDELRTLLPGFGAALAGDSTGVASRSNGNKNKETGTTSDTDASWRKYEHTFTDAQGNAHKSVKKWFGYKLHLRRVDHYNITRRAELRERCARKWKIPAKNPLTQM